MAIAAAPTTPDLVRRVVRLQVLAIAWMTVHQAGVRERHARGRFACAQTLAQGVPDKTVSL